MTPVKVVMRRTGWFCPDASEIVIPVENHKEVARERHDSREGE
jgi:hypothetical protein